MTTRHALLLAGVLAAGLTSACVGIPRDSGRYERDDGYGGYGGVYDDDYDDRVIWQQEHRRVSCSEIEQRIRYNREKIAEIPPGRHQKARQWYVDDIRNAERDLAECRSQRREERRDWDYDRDRERTEARAQCEKLRERIRFNQAKIREIPRGRHEKARQWYVDDIHNAERDMANARCRGR